MASIVKPSQIFLDITMLRLSIVYSVVILLSFCVHDAVAQILNPVKTAYSVKKRDLSQLDLQNLETFLWDFEGKSAIA